MQVLANSILRGSGTTSRTRMTSPITVTAGPSYCSQEPGAPGGRLRHAQDNRRRGGSGSAFDKAAFELGWDFGHYAVAPCEEWRGKVPALADGYAAGRRHFRGRSAVSDAFVRKWLRVRASDMVRGRVCDESVTPAYLRSIAPLHCPVTRQRLVYTVERFDDGCAANLWTVDRLNNDAGYIAGNLVVMSQKANLAKADLDFRELRATAIAAGKGAAGAVLTQEEWGRLAYLSSLTLDTADWREAASLPMLVAVPPGVYLSHSLAAMQLKLAQMPWRALRQEGCASWAKQFKGKHLQRAGWAVAEAFYQAVQVQQRRNPDHPWQWVAADAWTNAAVFDFWKRLVRALDDDDMRALVPKDQLSSQAIAAWCDAAGLENAGYVT